MNIEWRVAKGRPSKAHAYLLHYGWPLCPSPNSYAYTVPAEAVYDRCRTCLRSIARRASKELTP